MEQRNILNKQHSTLYQNMQCESLLFQYGNIFLIVLAPSNSEWALKTENSLQIPQKRAVNATLRDI